MGKTHISHVWSEVPDNSHVAISLSLPPLFPPKEFLDSLCVLSQVLCEVVLLAALTSLSLLFSLQRPTEGHTTAACRLSLSSVPRLPTPGVKLWVFVPGMLLLATAEAAGCWLQGCGHLAPSLPPHSCFPTWETFLSFTELGNSSFWASAFIFYLMNTTDVQQTFLLSLGWLRES